MKVLIAMAVHDTLSNQRTALTKQTIDSLIETVDLNYHTLYVVDNGSCTETKDYLNELPINIKVITNYVNVGTAKAINQAWKYRNAGQHVIKMDNDCVIDSFSWVDDMADCIEITNCGIVGLKRIDLNVNSLSVEVVKGKDIWHTIEYANEIMGTCTMFNSKLIDKIGGMYQMDKIYGFDDMLASLRCHLAGFKQAYLPHIPIEHIDKGGTDYTEWKRRYAGEAMQDFKDYVHGMINGIKPIYYAM